MCTRRINDKLNIIGNNIAKHRISKNWSQENLSRELTILGLPLHKNIISKIELQERTVSVCELWYLAKVFETTMEDFFIGVENELKFPA